MSFAIVVIRFLMLVLLNIPAQEEANPEKSLEQVYISTTDDIVKLQQKEIQLLDDAEMRTSHSEFRKIILSEPHQHNAGTHPVYWAKIQLNNQSSDTLNRLLLVDYPLAETIHLYHKNTGKVQQSGTSIPFRHHSIRNADMLFAVNLHPGMNVLYLQMASPVAKFPVALFTKTAYAQKKKMTHLYYALVGGFILIILVLNSYFYWLTKDKLHIYYLLYIILAIFTFLVYTGLAHQYIWPEFTFWNRHAFYVFQNLMIAAHIIFVSELLMLRVFKYRIHRILMGGAYMFCIAAVLSLFLSSFISYRIITWLCMLLFPLALLACYYPLRKRYKPAYFFMAVCIMFTFSVISSYARSLQDNAEPEGTCRSIAFALGVEIMTLSIAMGLRTKEQLQPAKKDKPLAQEQTDTYEYNEHHNPDMLSQKEQLVINYLEAGLTDQEIAEALNISINTVKTHLRNIYQKLEVRNRTEAILKVKYTENS